ncbi:MAG: response regulator [Verrucomicrobiota bacterium]|nr:response regulator [Verrucomicrobiota bacterium]
MNYESKSYGIGEYIIKEGEIGKGFYILEEGTLEVSRQGKVISHINQEGAMFGELSELLMSKRDASIIAKSEAKVRFFEVGLEDFVQKNPKFAVKIIRNLGRRLSRMNTLTIEGNTRNNFLQSAFGETTNDTISKNKILVIDDKPMIVEQIKRFSVEPGWEIVGANDISSAIAIAESTVFSAIIISCSLPNEGAVELRRKLKTNPKSSNTPVVGMVVKGDDLSMRKAGEAGFSEMITKPLEKNIVMSRLYHVLRLDPSDQYFEENENILVFRIPKIISPKLFEDIESCFSSRIRRTINNGIENVVMDLTNVEEVGEDTVELVGNFAEMIEELGNPFKLGFAAQGEDTDMWKNLDGCEEAEIFESVEDAKSQMT